MIPKAGFFTENQSESSGPVEIFLPSLSSHSSVREDKVSCPVRALKWYLNRSLPLRNSPDLFVTTTAPHCHASHSTLSRWIVEAIKSASSEALVSSTPRAHDTHSLSTSWALFNGATIDQIQKAAYWSNTNSFISCYLRDVVALEASFGLASLSASGSFRSGPSGSVRSTSH